MSFTGNQMIDGDDGKHPFSPFYLGESVGPELKKCAYCREEFETDELNESVDGPACSKCLEEIKEYERSEKE